MQTGGVVMYVIAGCSVLALAIFLERFWNLLMARTHMKKFMTQIIDFLRRKDISRAVNLCDKTQSSLANIVKAGIVKRNLSRADIKEAIEDAGTHEISKLEKNIGMLATIAHITPLLGLLGTVLGMVKAFQVIQEKATMLYPVNPGDLAGGIWEALITTVAGLSVAIPTFVAYNYLVNRVESVVLDMERNSSDLVNLLSGGGL